MTFSPAAADTLIAFLDDTGEDINSYDMILTGDLGKIGSDLLKEIILRNGYKTDKLYDCGLLIFDLESQDAHSGGSGCGCSASVLSGYIMQNLISKRIRKMLFIATGALMSPTTTQQGENIPGIAHLIEITCD